MIRRVMLGAILMCMVSTPVCAMQAMRRAAAVGARFVKQTAKNGTRFVKNNPVKIGSSVGGLGAAYYKIRDRYYKWGFFREWQFGKDMDEFAAVVAHGLSEDEKEHIANRSTASEFVDDISGNVLEFVDLFFLLDEEKQRDIVSLLVSEDFIWGQQRLFINLIYNKVTPQIKKIIKESIDFGSSLRVHQLLPISLEIFQEFSEQKQVEFVTSILKKDSRPWLEYLRGEPNDVLSDWEDFLVGVYKQGAGSVKKVIEQGIDFKKLNQYGYGYYNPVIKIFQEFSEQKQAEIVTSIMKKSCLSGDDVCFINAAYEQGKGLVKKVIEQAIDFEKLDQYSYEIEEIVEKVFQELSEQKQVEIVVSMLSEDSELLSEPNALNRRGNLISVVYEKGTEPVKKVIEQAIDFEKLEYYDHCFKNAALKVFQEFSEQKQAEIVVSILSRDSRSLLDYFMGREVDPVYWSDVELSLLHTDRGKKLFQQYILGMTDLDVSSPTIEHMRAHSSKTMCQYRNMPKQLQDLEKKLIQKQANDTDKLTFFHGQSWEWNLQAILTKKLYEKTHDVTVGDDFYFLRFLKKDMLYNEFFQRIAAYTGVHSFFFSVMRKNVLFANLGLFSNYSGSNTPHYVRSNSDQSSLRVRNTIEFIAIFSDWGFEKEINKLLSQQPDILERLEELHYSASKYGNFVTISIPKEFASKFAYPTHAGAPKIKYNGMDDVVEIAENFEKMPFQNEFCIVLGPNILDPVKAKEDGIEIKAWNTADPKIIVERDALIDKIIAKCVAMKESKA